MWKQLADVIDFHRKFKHPVAQRMTPVTDVPYQYRKFRMDRIREEAAELIEAIEQGSHVKIAREAVDLIYVVLGALVIFGIPFGPIWDAVHRANMQKVPAAGPLEKPLKPAGWQSPDEEIEAHLTALQNSEAIEEHPDDEGMEAHLAALESHPKLPLTDEEKIFQAQSDGPLPAD